MNKEVKMLKLAIILSSMCPNPVVENRTEVWNKADQTALESATKRCSQKFQNSPCLKKFTKVRENQYQAICGKPTSREGFGV